MLRITRVLCLARPVYLVAVLLCLMAPSVSHGQALATLRIIGCPCDAFHPVYYGIASGLFRRYGLNVELITVPSGAAAMASVVSGDTQVAFTSVVPLLQARAHGVALEIVSPGAWYNSDAAPNALFVKKDSPIRTARDLNGKTIAVQSIRDLNWAATLNWIDKNGGNSNSVRVIELPLPSVVPAIDEGRIDAGSLAPPFMEQGIAAGKVRLLAKSYDAISAQFEAAVYVSRSDYVAANPEPMRAFARAMHEAIVYTNAHQAETIPLVAEHTNVEASVIAQSVRTRDPEYLDPQLLTPLIEVAVRYKLIDRAVTPQELFSPVMLRRPH